jgi:hypothetical protein
MESVSLNIDERSERKKKAQPKKKKRRKDRTKWNEVITTRSRRTRTGTSTRTGAGTSKGTTRDRETPLTKLHTALLVFVTLTLCHRLLRREQRERAGEGVAKLPVFGCAEGHSCTWKSTVIASQVISAIPSSLGVFCWGHAVPLSRESLNLVHQVGTTEWSYM